MALDLILRVSSNPISAFCLLVRVNASGVVNTISENDRPQYMFWESDCTMSGSIHAPNILVPGLEQPSISPIIGSN